MSFVHPGIMFFAAGLALAPVIIHLIHRRRYPREPWAAMDFLLAAHHTTRRRLHMQHWILMLIRCMVILLLGMTVARPYASSAAIGGTLGQARSDRVIVLDDSFSMNARRADGGTSFNAAKQRALSLIDQAGGGDGLALLTASTLGRTWMNQPVHDRQAVRGILEPLDCGDGMNDLAGGIRAADEILGHGSAAAGGRIAYLLTDLTKASLPASLTSEHLANIDRLIVVDTGGEDRRNVAISEFRPIGQLVGAGIPTRYLARISNHGEKPIEKQAVEILLDGSAARTIEVGPIGAHAFVDAEIELPIARIGDHRLTARLAHHTDALPDDDVRYLVTHVADTLPVLLVEGRPSAPPSAEELLYVTTALCGDPAENTSFFRGRTIAASELPDQKLGDFALIVLGNVPRITADAWSRLSAYVRDGGAVMIFLGDQISPESYALAESLLPIRPVKFQVMPADAEPLRFRIADATHPALNDLSRHERGGLLLANVRAHWQTSGADRSAVRTLLSLSNGDPVLETWSLGRGRVMAWMIGPQMAETNLPAKPDYVPLLLNLACNLAAPSSGDLNLLVGQTWTWRHPAMRPGSSIDLQLPSGRMEQLLVDTGAADRPQAAYENMRQPGFYTARMDAARALVAVNVDQADSNLDKADEQMLRSHFGPKAELLKPRTDGIRTATFNPPREFAGLFGFSLITLVITETVLATWFGSRR